MNKEDLEQIKRIKRKEIAAMERHAAVLKERSLETRWYAIRERRRQRQKLGLPY